MKKRWFTLVEMLIVIVIIWILAAALLPQIWSARDKANDTAREANVRTLVTALVQYGMDHTDWYPTADSNDLTTDWPVANDDLTKYGVPANNFHNNPTNSIYQYKKLKWDHFIVFVNLSCEDDAEPTCGNCDKDQISTYNTDTARTEADFTSDDHDDLNSFCQLQ